MTTTQSGIPRAKLFKMGAAVLVGLGIGTALKASVALPSLGSVSGVALGDPLLLVGGVLYTQGPRLLVRSGGSGCGCEGDCECS